MIAHPTAAALAQELRDQIAGLHELPEVTKYELIRALDRVVEAAVAEARGPAVTGDVFALVREAMCATPQHFFLQDRTARLIEELTKRGVVVLGKRDYDRLTRIEAAGRKLERRVAAYYSCVAEMCGGTSTLCPCSSSCSEYMDEMCDAADAFVQVADTASRAEGRKGSE